MLNRFLGDIRYGECFSRTSLSVGEQSNYSFLEESRQKRFDLELIHMSRSFFVPVGVVEHEFVVLDVLCDTVNFYLRLVYLYAWIKATHRIDLAQRYLFFK